MGTTLSLKDPFGPFYPIFLLIDYYWSILYQDGSKSEISIIFRDILNTTFNLSFGLPLIVALID